jgi:ribosomal-protein-alanine N-acetyltransferase
VAHAPEMFQVLSDPAIYEFENAPPETEEWLCKRYERLERRGPDAGNACWLNWVIRLPSGALAGYVQATVLPDGKSCVAYELASRYWRQGIGSAALGVMLEELRGHYSIQTYIAVLKAGNFRSQALLLKSGFVPASAAQMLAYRDGPDEIVMIRSASDPAAESLNASS